MDDLLYFDVVGKLTSFYHRRSFLLSKDLSPPAEPGDYFLFALLSNFSKEDIQENCPHGQFSLLMANNGQYYTDQTI